MLEVCKNDAQMATVLGHEMAHNICHHAGENASRSGLYWGGLILFSILVGDFTFTSAFALDLLWQRPAQRGQESEADHVGLLIMAASCYDPKESLDFWSRMEQIQASKGQEIPQFLSTHPDNLTRIHQLQAL